MALQTPSLNEIVDVAKARRKILIKARYEGRLDDFKTENLIKLLRKNFSYEYRVSLIIRRHFFICWIALHPLKFSRWAIAKKQNKTKHGEMYRNMQYFLTWVTFASGHCLRN